MSLLDPERMQITFFPAILYLITSRPATERAPAGSRMMASSSYISSIVLATKPSLIR